MAENDIYLVRQKNDGTFEELGDSPFAYSGLTGDVSDAGNEFLIKTKLRVPELKVEGTTTIVDQDVTTSEQLLITNDGTGPAVVINQLGTEAVLDVQDDGASALYVRGDSPYAGYVGLGTTTPTKQLELTGDILLANDNAIYFNDVTAGTPVAKKSLYQDSAEILTLANTGGDGVNIKTGDSSSFLALRIDQSGFVGIGSEVTAPTAHLDIVRDGQSNIKFRHKSNSAVGEIDIDMTQTVGSVQGVMTIGTKTNHALTLGTNNVGFLKISQGGNISLERKEVNGVMTTANLTIEGELSVPNATTFKVAGEELLWTDEFSVTGANHAESFKFLEFSYRTHGWDDGSPFIIEIWSEYYSATGYQKYLVCHTHLDTDEDGTQGEVGAPDLDGGRDYQLKILESTSSPPSAKFRLRMGTPEDTGLNDGDGYDIATVAVHAELKHYAKTRIKITSLASNPTAQIGTNDDWTTASDEYKFYTSPIGVDITNDWDSYSFDPTGEDALYADALYGSRMVNNVGTDVDPTEYFLKPAVPGISMTLAGKIQLNNDTGIFQKHPAGNSSTLINLYSDQNVGIYDGKLNVNASGNVGIGTTSPDALLEISGPHVSQKGMLHLDGDTHVMVCLDADAASNSDAEVQFRHDGVQKYGIGWDGSEGYFRFYDGLKSDMVILPSGNVGIGTDDPQMLLHTYVADSYNQTIIESGLAGSSAACQLLTPEGKWILENRLLAGQTASDFAIRQSGGTNPGDKFVVKHETGNVGIGTATPTAALHINSTVGGDGVARADYPALRIGSWSNHGIKHGSHTPYWGFAVEQTHNIKDDPSTVIFSATCSTVEGSSTINHDTNPSIVAGLSVSGAGIIAGAYISEILHATAFKIARVSNDEELLVTLTEAVNTLTFNDETDSGNWNSYHSTHRGALLQVNHTGLIFASTDPDTTDANGTDGTYAEHMRIRSSDGNVGIGTDDPGVGENGATKLHLKGGQMRIDGNGAVSTSSVLYFGDAVGSPNHRYIGADIAGNLLIRPANDSHIGFCASGNADAMRFDKDGNLGIGLNNPHHRLEVVGGTVRLQPNTAKPGFVFGSFNNDTPDGTYLQFGWAGGNNLSGHTASKMTMQSIEQFGTNQGGYRDLILNEHGGDVGIGTADPNYTLDVAGNINFTGTLYEDGVAFSGGGGGGGGGGGEWSSNNPDIYFNTGNVGIGTNDPASTLDLSKTSDTNERALKIQNSKTNLYVGVEGTTANRFTGSLPDTAFIGTTTPDHLTFATNNEVKMVIKTDGNVGIGTASPDEKLDIEAGNLKFSGVSTNGLAKIYANDDANLTLGTGAGAKPRIYLKGISNGEADAGDIYMAAAGGSSDLVIQSGTGNVGIGTSSLWTNLNIKGSSSSPVATDVDPVGIMSISTDDTYTTLLAGTYTNAPYAFWLQASHRNLMSNQMALALNPVGGNVGIGTSDPEAPLDIVGPDGPVTTANDGLIIRAGATNDWLTMGTDSSTRTSWIRPVRSTVGNNKLQLDATAVGIGTTSPGTKLDVVAGSGSTNSIAFSDTGQAGHYGYLAAGSSSISIRRDSNASGISIAQATGNVGIGLELNQKEKLHVDGALRLEHNTSPNTSGAAGAGTIWWNNTITPHGKFVYRDGNGDNLNLDGGAINYNYTGTVWQGTPPGSSGDIYFNQGNVSIGTTSPTQAGQTYMLRVNGPALFHGDTIDDYGNQFGNVALANEDNSNRIILRNIGGANKSIFRVGALFSTEDHRVGINTSDPDAVLGTAGLAVDGPAHAKIAINALAGEALLSFYEDSAHKATIQHMGASFATASRRGDLEFHNNGGDFVFHPSTGDEPRMVLNTDGNVGIGTDSPVTALDVKGDPGEGTGTSDGLLSLVGGVDPGGADNYRMTFGINAAGDSWIQPRGSSGNWQGNILLGPHSIGGLGVKVGIGTTSPQGPLHISADEAAITLTSSINSVGSAQIRYDGEAANPGLQFRIRQSSTDGTSIVQSDTKMIIAPDGNVGIGTDDPLNKLHVRGPTPADGFSASSTAMLAIESEETQPGAADRSRLNFGLLPYGGLNGAEEGNAYIQARTADLLLQPGDGNVGIGEVAPVRRLEVKGHNNLTSTLKITNTNTSTLPPENTGILEVYELITDVSVFISSQEWDLLPAADPGGSASWQGLYAVRPPENNTWAIQSDYNDQSLTFKAHISGEDGPSSNATWGGAENSILRLYERGNSGFAYTPAIITHGYQPPTAEPDAFELQASHTTKTEYSKIITFDQSAGGVYNFHLVFPYDQGNGGLQYKLTIVGGRTTGASSAQWIVFNAGTVIDESYHYWETDGDFGNNSSYRSNMIEAASGVLELGAVTDYLADSAIATSQGSEGGSEPWDYAIVRYPITLPGPNADDGTATPQGKFAVHLEVYDGLKRTTGNLKITQPPKFLYVP